MYEAAVVTLILLYSVNLSIKTTIFKFKNKGSVLNKVTVITGLYCFLIICYLYGPQVLSVK